VLQRAKWGRLSLGKFVLEDCSTGNSGLLQVQRNSTKKERQKTTATKNHSRETGLLMHASEIPQLQTPGAKQEDQLGLGDGSKKGKGKKKRKGRGTGCQDTGERKTRRDLGNRA